MSTRYITARQVAATAEQLTNLDRQLLDQLARCRVATTDQLRRLVAPHAHPRAWQGRLARLTKLRVIARLPRRVGGIVPGSAPWSYVLDVAGWRLLGQVAPRRPGTPGVLYLRHTLLATEVYVQAVELAHAQSAVVVADFRGEPACWQRLAGGGWLKPDGRLVLAAPGVEDSYYIEVDTGSESGPAVSRKLDIYRQHWASGVEQARCGVFPRVLFVTLTNERARQLAARFTRQPQAAQALFAVTTLDRLSGYLATDLPTERPPPLAIQLLNCR